VRVYNVETHERRLVEAQGLGDAGKSNLVPRPGRNCHRRSGAELICACKKFKMRAIVGPNECYLQL
jgi:hypothetical protein